MPTFPTLIKTWQPPIIVSLPQEANATLQNAKAAVAMKNAFLAPTISPWAMKACCDSTATSTSADLIVNETDIVNNAVGAHTWFVLRNSITSQEFCVDFDQANNQTIHVVVSFGAGFTGGSTTARPTATDEAAPGFVSTLAFGNNVGRFKLFLMHSTDGKVSYLFMLYQGLIMSACCFGEMQAHHGAWTPPLIGFIEGSNALATSGLNTIVRLNTVDRIMARAAGGTMLLRTTSAVSHGNRLEISQGTRESPTGKWQIWPVGLACINSPRRGRHGLFVDIFRVPSFVPPGWIFRSDDGGLALMAIGSGWLVPWHPDFAPKVT